MPRDDALTYEREMGRAPENLPDDHPDLWQWKYRGTKSERETLLADLGVPEEPVVIEGQEEMFEA